MHTKPVGVCVDVVGRVHIWALSGQCSSSFAWSLTSTLFRMSYYLSQRYCVGRTTWTHVISNFSAVTGGSYQIREILQGPRCQCLLGRNFESLYKSYSRCAQAKRTEHRVGIREFVGEYRTEMCSVAGAELDIGVELGVNGVTRGLISQSRATHDDSHFYQLFAPT